MEIGLYFGSFNPIHIGHLIIANHIANTKEIDQVWFVVSPQNPLKQSNTLLNEYHRLHLTKLAVEGNPHLRVSDVEFKLPKPSYTIDTLTYLTEKYPKDNFNLIIGSDSYLNLSKWKNYNLILERYKLLIYERPSYPVKDLAPNTKILKAPLLEISATDIRKLVRENKSIRYLVTEKVREEIETNNYYK